MKYNIIKTLCLTLILLCTNQLFAQENYFTSISLIKKSEISENWQSLISTHWKNYYNHRGWKRIGIDANISRKFGDWKFYGGMVTNFTIDQSAIEDNWEIRPWLGIGLESKFVEKLYLEQIFKLEFRNFIFDQERENVSITRTQYKVKPFYVINDKCQIYTELIWYFLPIEDLPLRFLGSKEWVLGFAFNYPKSTIKLYYSREKFSPLEGFEVEENANTINLLYMF